MSRHRLRPCEWGLKEPRPVRARRFASGVPWKLTAMNGDSTVNLTFHFWSGTTLEYTLERSGTTVTGSAA
ncbi:hypothetical protein [Glycomyces sp. YM15]|uniref:hypothetical protein n=1 Tax=Glycomyces sp. YM15 TaxID=2800446 RepID=UPI001966BEAC|nr:hypothetical protein [Glycomyces sp. YM15]